MPEVIRKKDADLPKLKASTIEITSISYGATQLEVDVPMPAPEGLEALLKDCAAGNFRISGKLISEKGKPEFYLELDGDSIRIYADEKTAQYIRSIINR